MSVELFNPTNGAPHHMCNAVNRWASVMTLDEAYMTHVNVQKRKRSIMYSNDAPHSEQIELLGHLHASRAIIHEESIRYVMGGAFWALVSAHYVHNTSGTFGQL